MIKYEKHQYEMKDICKMNVSRAALPFGYKSRFDGGKYLRHILIFHADVHVAGFRCLIS